jgi:GNAT superfamily N-acetyltransferase
MSNDTPVPFAAATYQLSDGDGASLLLEPIDSTAARSLAAAMTAVDPWRTLGTDPAKLADYLTVRDPHCHRRLIRHGGEIAGVAAVRNPWLYGPYLALLAVLPQHQCGGIGAAVLGWMEAQARTTASNLWVCVSCFNMRAQTFYQRHGFAPVARLEALVHAESTELLLRKRLV